MSKNVELFPGDVVIRSGPTGSRASAVMVQLTHEQTLTLSVQPHGPGDNQRRVNVTWKQGPLIRDRDISIGYVVIDPIYKTLTGANGEDLTR